jgi:hypothetical protein
VVISVGIIRSVISLDVFKVLVDESVAEIKRQFLIIVFIEKAFSPFVAQILQHMLHTKDALNR